MSRHKLELFLGLIQHSIASKLCPTSSSSCADLGKTLGLRRMQLRVLSSTAISTQEEHGPQEHKHLERGLNATRSKTRIRKLLSSGLLTELSGKRFVASCSENAFDLPQYCTKHLQDLTGSSDITNHLTRRCCNSRSCKSNLNIQVATIPLTYSLHWQHCWKVLLSTAHLFRCLLILIVLRRLCRKTASFSTPALALLSR